jgi:hypothetical protein
MVPRPSKCIFQTCNQKPFLCKDRDSVRLNAEDRALRARDQNDTEKSKRLGEIASQLQSELCSALPDDIVLLRCKLDQQGCPGTLVSNDQG